MNKQLNTAIAVGVSLIVVGFLFWGDMFMNIFIPQSQNQDQNMEISTGVRTEDLRAGTGAVASTGDTVTVHYVGNLTDGRVFDSSRDRGAPFVFRLGAGEVIRGWDEGVAGMRVGGVRRLTIAPDYGYGSTPVGPIPANSVLVFEVELLGVEKPTQ